MDFYRRHQLTAEPLRGVRAGLVYIMLTAAASAGMTLPGWAACETTPAVYLHGIPGKVAACGVCHGAQGGGGADGRIPRLAGLPGRYLKDQLLAFRGGRRRNDTMARVAAALTGKQIGRVAAYAAKLPGQGSAPPAAHHRPFGDAARLVTRGDWGRHLPPCSDCHGATLMGGGPRIPPLAGQGAAYLAAQLRAYRRGARPAGPLHLMGDIARRLSDTEITGLANYIAAVVPGERPRAPEETTAPWPLIPRSPDSFAPPPASAMPVRGRYAALLRLGQRIFDDTPRYAPQYVGNSLSCRNCHLDRGRLASSIPLWAAVPRYPRYRRKSHRVVTLEMRIRGCFRYSENGTPPPPDSKVIIALSAYLHWLATGLPIGMPVPAEGLPRLAPPSAPPDRVRGRRVYRQHCALCHGRDGGGRTVAGQRVFPPLWGPESFNWGAGMHRIDKAAAFIEANMPLSQGGSLSDQQAWDVAAYMDTQPRSQDPRFTGDVGLTRQRYHAASQYDAYGKQVDGRRLGAPGTSAK